MEGFPFPSAVMGVAGGGVRVTFGGMGRGIATNVTAMNDTATNFTSMNATATVVGGGEDAEDRHRPAAPVPARREFDRRGE